MSDQDGGGQLQGLNEEWRDADQMTDVIASAKKNYALIMGAAFCAGISTVLSGLIPEKSSAFTVAAGLFTIAIPTVFFVGNTRRNRLFDEIADELDRTKALRRAGTK